MGLIQIELSTKESELFNKINAWANEYTEDAILTNIAKINAKPFSFYSIVFEPFLNQFLKVETEIYKEFELNQPPSQLFVNTILNLKLSCTQHLVRSLLNDILKS